MSYKIEVTDRFEKEIRKLLKKFPSLKDEYAGFITTLKADPLFGTPIGNDCYKIRIAIASKGRGKSGGARIITHVYVAAQTVFLLSIYDKSDQESLTDKEILSLVKGIR